MPRSGGPPEVEIRCSTLAPAVPRRRPDRINELFRVWTGSDTLHLELTSGARARVSAGSAWIGTGVDDPDRAMHFLFPAVITQLLAFQDRFVLHAGGVVAGEGAYLLLGSTGTGKSTLAAAALERGWVLLGDDMVVLRHVDGRTEATGIPRRVAVPADVGFRGPSAPLARDARGRVALSATVLDPGWFTVVGLICVGHGSSAGASLDGVRGGDALRVVLGSYTSSLDPVRLRRFFPVAAALSRLPAWALGHGAEARTRLAEAGRVLAVIENGAPS